MPTREQIVDKISELLIENFEELQYSNIAEVQKVVSNNKIIRGKTEGDTIVF